MEIPDDWQEELLLHDWKRMRIERCKLAAAATRNIYDFPNGIHFHHLEIKIDFERAKTVFDAVSDFEPKMKVKKGIASIRLNWDCFRNLSQGELEDFEWRLYSLDI